MRKSFINTLIQLAEHDSRIFLLTADLGYLIIEPFQKQFPDRFINVGVAEQNMVGIATGLAEAGLIPFIYSITPFAVLRPYEFIRNGPIYHHFPVRIIGIGEGFEYSHDGISHFAVEDVGVLRIQDGITIVAPADHEQAANALLKTWELPQPVYYRLNKNEQYVVPGLNGDFSLGNVQLIHEGQDILIISMGGMAEQVVNLIPVLEKKDVSVSHVIISSLNPSPDSDLINLLASFPLVFTVESHYIVGGIGSYVAELIAENNIGCRLVRCGIDERITSDCGSQKYMLQRYHLSSDELVKKIEMNLSVKP